MSSAKQPPFSRLGPLIGLILGPVVLLGAIAVFGLVQYRHAVTEDARIEAGKVAAPARVDQIIEDLRTAALAHPPPRLFNEIPEAQSEDSPDIAKLAEATSSGDQESLQKLTASTGMTSAGLPIRVLAAWRLLDLTGQRSEAERLATLAIDEEPSAISKPIMQSLAEKFPDEQQWQSAWHVSQTERAIITRHPNADGFVAEVDGVAFIVEGHLLTPPQLRAFFKEIHSKTDMPPWLELDFMALGTSMASPIETPFVTSGSELRIVTGIVDRRALYAGYWRLVIWAAALIFCSLATAILGICLVQRTLARERRISELKSQFVASVSHELRTPVASMRLMADALDAGKVKGKAAKNFHRLMSQEGARLSSLIENVLDFARIEEGRKEYSFTESDLPALIADTVQLMQPVAQQREIEITTDIAKLPEEPSLDTAAIQQALINLIDNAIKFSPKGGEIQVSLSAKPDSWELSVSDGGPGIPKPDRQRIFERFTRLGNELRRETQGTGIGLSIVKHIIEAHGADIVIEENQPTGTKFVIHGKFDAEQSPEPSRAIPSPDLAPRPCDS